MLLQYSIKILLFEEKNIPLAPNPQSGLFAQNFGVGDQCRGAESHIIRQFSGIHMRFGLTLSETGPMAEPDNLTSLAQQAEKLGFYAVDLGDHVVIPQKISSPYPYSDHGNAPIWEDFAEQLTTLSFLAAKTTSIHLLTSVMVLPYRHPILAAKMIATIDVLSKGRLIVGAGVGWMEEEFEALRSPPFDERGLVSEEYTKIFKELWTEENPRFQGKFFSFQGIKFAPKPIQKPHPPIWVGGESPGALRRAARIGNAWYPIDANPRYPLRTLEELRVSISQLRDYAKEARRDPDDIQICLLSQGFKLTNRSNPDELFVGDTNKIISDIHACAKLGISYIGFSLLDQNLKSTIHNMTSFAREIMSSC